MAPKKNSEVGLLPWTLMSIALLASNLRSRTWVYSLTTVPTANNQTVFKMKMEERFFGGDVDTSHMTYDKTKELKKILLFKPDECKPDVNGDDQCRNACPYSGRCISVNNYQTRGKLKKPKYQCYCSIDTNTGTGQTLNKAWTEWLTINETELRAHYRATNPCDSKDKKHACSKECPGDWNGKCIGEGIIVEKNLVCYCYPVQKQDSTSARLPLTSALVFASIRRKPTLQLGEEVGEHEEVDYHHPGADDPCKDVEEKEEETHHQTDQCSERCDDYSTGHCLNESTKSKGDICFCNPMGTKTYNRLIPKISKTGSLRRSLIGSLTHAGKQSTAAGSDKNSIVSRTSSYSSGHHSILK